MKVSLCRDGQQFHKYLYIDRTGLG